MLTFRAYIAIGVAVVLIAMGCAIAVQTKRLRESQDTSAILSERLATANRRADAAEAQGRKAEAESATQAEEAAIVCQGEGAELFNAGKRTGIAIGLSRCPAS